MNFKIPWISIRLVNYVFDIGWVVVICSSKELPIMSWFVKALCEQFVIFSSYLFRNYWVCRYAVCL